MLFQPKQTIKKFLNQDLGLKVIDIFAFSGLVFIGLAIVSTLLENSNVTIHISSQKLQGYK